MSARFEIVRTDAEQPWHARFRAGNGRIVWTTQNYRSRGSAVNGLVAVASEFSWGGVAEVRWRDSIVGDLLISHGGFRDALFVQIVDEREVKP